MQCSLKSVGDLRCRIVIPRNEAPSQLIVLCHGYGAPGDDLVDLAPALCQIEPDLAQRSVFVFPEALLELDFAGFGNARAWWHLDIEAIAASQQGGPPRILAQEEPDGLPVASSHLAGTLEILLPTFGLGWPDLILGGFSQGAMLAADVALHSETSPRKVVLLSGNLLNERRSLPKIRTQRSLSVFMSHGRQDPILPFEGAQALKNALVEAHAEVEFLSFDGGHAIPFEVVARLARFLNA